MFSARPCQYIGGATFSTDLIFVLKELVSLIGSRGTEVILVGWNSTRLSLLRTQTQGVEKSYLSIIAANFTAKIDLVGMNTTKEGIM